MECSWNDGDKTQYYYVILDQLQDHSGELVWAPESCVRGPLPSKVAAPRSNSSGLEKSVKVCPVDVSWDSWILSVILRDEV